MKIAVMGIRGIPANYGGFETFADNLSRRLVERGHDVTVYGRSNIIKTKQRTYAGASLVVLPTISHKYLDTIVHTCLSVVHSLWRGYDVVLICNAANAVFSWLPRVAGAKVVLNVDGIERRRKKWNRVAKAYYRVSEWLSTFLPNVVVTDARVIQDYYLDKYSKESVMIPYGAAVTRSEDGASLLKEYQLEPGGYVLYVSRLEPENNAHLVVEAFESVETDKELVIVGDAPYAGDYVASLKRTIDPRIQFPGFVFGEAYRALQQNAYCYVQATEVGGTHPALLEALGFGNCVLALDTPEHREVAAEAAIYYADGADLARQLERVLKCPDVVAEKRGKGMARVSEHYGWLMVADQYEGLFAELLGES